MTRFLLTILCMLLASVVSAQPATPTSKLLWDQPNVASAAKAQAYTFRYYADGSATGTILTGVVCTGTATVTCSAAYPAFTPGPHSLTLSAANAAGEGPKSAPFTFTFVIVPSAPVNIRSGD